MNYFKNNAHLANAVLYVMLFLCFLPAIAFGQDCIHIREHQQYSLSSFASTQTDASVSIQGFLQADTLKKFTISNHPYFGYTTNAVWLYVDIENHLDEETLFFEVKHATLDNVQFYLLKDTTVVDQSTAGIENLVESRYRTYMPLVSFKLKKRVRYRLVIKVVSSSSVYLPLHIRSLEHYAKVGNNTLSFTKALVFGLLIIAFINFFVFFTTRELQYLLFTCVIATFTFYFFLFYGHLGDFDIYLTVSSYIRLRVSFFSFSYLFATGFSVFFFRIKRTDRASVIAVGSMFLLFGLYLILTLLHLIPASVVNSVALFAYPIGSILLVVVGLLQWRKKRAAAIIFVTAHLIFTICSITYLTMLWGIFPHYFIVYHITIYGAFLYAAVLTFSLNIKIDKLNKEMRKTQDLQQISMRLQSEIESRMVAELELRELNLSKDKFISIIAHDLKSPFTAILGFGEMLQTHDHEAKPDKTKFFADQLMIAATKAFQLLEDLLTWSRAESGSIIFSPENTNLCSLTNDVIEGLSPVAAKKSISIVNCFAPECKICVDSNMVETILRNLIANAIKFTNKGGTISIHMQDYQTDVVMSIVDNGVGMTGEQIEHLFQIDNATSTQGTSNESGTGLGLLVCKEFVDRHSGAIWAESEPGEGSSFSFLLPRVSENSEILS